MPKMTISMDNRRIDGFDQPPVLSGLDADQGEFLLSYSRAASAKRQADALEAIAASLVTIAARYSATVAPVTLADKLDPEVLRQATEAGLHTPATDGWIEWHGGECPVPDPDHTPADIKWSNGTYDIGKPAGLWRWRWSLSATLPNITAYRLAK